LAGVKGINRFNRRNVERYVSKVLTKRHFNPAPIIAPILDCREVSLIRQGICPFCERDYGSVRKLRTHLHRNRRCSIAFSILVKELARKYVEFREAIRYRRVGGIYVVKLKANGHTFLSFYEAFNYLNPRWWS